MEGFLKKKARGSSLFARKAWAKRWFVVEGDLMEVRTHILSLYPRACSPMTDTHPCLMGVACPWACP